MLWDGTHVVAQRDTGDDAHAGIPPTHKTFADISLIFCESATRGQALAKADDIKLPKIVPVNLLAD